MDRQEGKIYLLSDLTNEIFNKRTI